MSTTITKTVSMQRKVGKYRADILSRLNLSTGIKPFDSIPTKKYPLIPQSLNLAFSGGPGYLHEHCDKLHRELGPIFRERLGSLDLVFLADTQLIHNVIAQEGKYPHHNVPEPWKLYNEIKHIDRGLFFQIGEPWAKLRHSFNKVMLANQTNITRFGSDILNISENFLDNCVITGKRISESDDTVILDDIKSELCKWSIETTGFVLFGERLGCVPMSMRGGKLALSDQRAEKLVDNVAKMFTETSNLQVLPCRLAQKWRLAPWMRFEEASDEMLKIANEMTEEFLTRAKHIERPSIIRDLINLNQLDDDEISRSIVDLLIAAADTTSNSVQWMLYLVAKYPEVQNKLAIEAEALLEQRSTLDWNRLRQICPYLSAFLKEASRLYPTAPFLARTLDHETVLNGYKVPAGKPIVFSLYSTSRMEKYYEEPSKFKPERWMRQSRSNQSESFQGSNAYASLPFGVGSRMCIGRRAAELEMSILLAALVSKFHAKLPPGQGSDEIKIKLKMILSPDRPISLMLTPRIKNKPYSRSK